MTTIALERTRVQRLEALELANRIRTRRAEVKRQLRRREVRLAALLADPPEWLLSMKVSELVSSAPGWGPKKTRRLLLAVHASDVKTVGGLSGRQRDELVRALGGTFGAAA